MNLAGMDYEAVAARYDTARSLPLQDREGWRTAISPHVASTSNCPTLDVGSGTGLWSIALARWFQTQVVALEPSAAMRREAAARRPHLAVLHVGGIAEQLPLKAGSCGAAWLSTVVHHIRDLPAAAADLRRVLRRDSPVLIRNAFSDRADEIPWLQWFPRARQAALRSWPAVADVVNAFESAGFAFRSIVRITEASAPDLAVYTRKVALRVDSTLAGIPDREFEQGIAAMEAAAKGEGLRSQPITTGLDLIVLN